MSNPAVDPEIESLRELVSDCCLSFPEATVEEGGEHRIYRVRNRTFAYFLYDHHGDGEIAVSCKVEPEMNRALIDAEPERFFFPSYVGPRGWVAIRLSVPEVDWDEITDLITMSYTLVAPRTLARRLNDS